MTSLTDLPTELIHKICKLLPVQDVVSLSETCDSLNKSINQRSFWLNRLSGNGKRRYSCFPDKKIDWKQACILHETLESWFSSDSGNVVKRTCRHYSAHCIDALQILKPPSRDLFAIGDRGGTFSILSIKSLLTQDEPRPIFTDANAHSGWIWALSNDRNTIATGSWDQTFRIWAIRDSGVDSLIKYPVKSAALASDFVDPNLIALGAFAHRVSVYDLRVPNKHPALFNDTYHLSAVLTLKAPYGSIESLGGFSSGFSSATTLNLSEVESDLVSNFGDMTIGDSDVADGVFPTSPVARAGDPTLLMSPPSSVAFFSGCMAGKLAAWDLRKFSAPLMQYRFRSYPRKISLMDSEEMWVAEHSTKLHVFRIASPRAADGLPVLKPIHTCKYSTTMGSISALEATPGGVFLALMSRQVDVLHPTLPPSSMLAQPIINDSAGIYVSLSFAQDTLLTAGDGGRITMWIAKSQAERLLSSDESSEQ